MTPRKWQSSTANVIKSSYHKQKKFDQENECNEKKLGKCPSCNKEHNLYKFFKSTKKWNERPFSTYFDCKPPRKRENTRRAGGEASGLYSSMGAITNMSADESANPIEVHPNCNHEQLQHSELLPVTLKKPIVLTTKIFDNSLGWQNAKQQHHPHIRLRITTVEDDYDALRVEFPRIAPTYINVVTDTGAQSCLWGLKKFLSCGFKSSDLIKVDHQISAANRMPIRISDAIIVRLYGKDDHEEKLECAVMVFISPDATEFFLLIDMSDLNKICKREPHGSKTPFQMARAIPRGTWKSVQDTWNGCHSKRQTLDNLSNTYREIEIC